MDAFLADIIVVVHFLIVAFCVLGEVAILLGATLKWHWIRNMPFRVIHLALVLFVAGEAIFGITCPLTKWEYNLRMAAGESYDRDLPFVVRLIRSVIFYDFPTWVFTSIYICFGILILLTFIFIKPQHTRARH
jgi:hypothetical protein